MKKLSLLFLLFFLWGSGIACAQATLSAGEAAVPEEIPHGQIQDIVLLNGHYYGRTGGRVLRMTPDGKAWRHAEFEADISYVQPKLLTDEGKLLFFDGAGFHVIPTEEGLQITPIYENISFAPNFFYELFVNDTEIIYCYLLEDMSSYGMQVERYNKQSGARVAEYYPDIMKVHGLYKDSALFGCKSNEQGNKLYALKDGQAIPIELKGLQDSKAEIYDTVYHAAYDAFYASSSDYIFRLQGEEMVPMALNIDMTTDGNMLLKDDKTLVIYTRNGFVELPHTTVLDTSSIVSVYRFYDPDLFEAFNKLQTGYLAAPPMETNNSSPNQNDVSLVSYPELQQSMQKEDAVVPMDLSKDSELVTLASSGFDFIVRTLYHNAKLQFMPYNVYSYDSEIEPFNLMYHVESVQKLLQNEEPLPQTYAELVDFVLRKTDAQSRDYAVFLSNDTPYLPLMLSLNYVNQYRAQCFENGISPDIAQMKEQLQNIQKLCDYVRNEEYETVLFRKMDDVLTMMDGYAPLPLTPDKSSKSGLALNMDVLLINDKSEKKHGALHFLRFAMEHMPEKNKFKLFKPDSPALQKSPAADAPKADTDKESIYAPTTAQIEQYRKCSDAMYIISLFQHSEEQQDVLQELQLDELIQETEAQWRVDE